MECVCVDSTSGDRAFISLLTFPRLETSHQLVLTCHSALICGSQKLPACDSGHTLGNGLTDRLNQMRVAACSFTRSDFSGYVCPKVCEVWFMVACAEETARLVQRTERHLPAAHPWIRIEHGEAPRNHGHPMHPSPRPAVSTLSCHWIQEELDERVRLTLRNSPSL